METLSHPRDGGPSLLAAAIALFLCLGLVLATWGTNVVTHEKAAYPRTASQQTALVQVPV